MSAAATLGHPRLADVGLDAELAVWDAVMGDDAEVIDLEAHRHARVRATRALHLRRRLGLVLAVLGAAIALVLLIGAGGATADLERPAITGQTVVEPGESLWDVAVANAPAGVDARVYLQAIRDVNGFATADVPAWTVVLLPAGLG